MLKEKFGLDISTRTIRRRLQLDGLNGGVCTRKPLLRPVNKLKRLLWAIRHLNWSPEQRKRVLWTDEKKFELFNTKRRTYCRKRVGEQLRDDTVQGTVKHGGGSVMFWGSVGNNRTAGLTKVVGIMDKTKYKGILEKDAIPSGQAALGD
jgi:Fe-S cluster biosynthesis and repair protein YggX